MSGVRAITESLILTVVIAAANALFGASDPGWLKLNPTPYVLVPIFVGVRYGFVPGLIGGIIAGFGAALGASMLGGQSFSEVFAQHTFTLLAMPTLGALAGEIYRTISSRAQSVGHKADALENDVARLGAELALAHEAQGQLQEYLAMHGAQFSSADVELGKLFDPGAVPLLPGTLAALDQLCDVGAAAFYHVGANNNLELECAYGDVDRFPATLGSGSAKIAQLALREGKLVTCRELIESGGAGDGFLAALPFESGERSLVLVIADMPFAAVHWQNFARIEVFCRWVTETEKAGSEASPVLDKESLHQRFELAAKTVTEQGLPSTVVLFTAAVGVAGGLDQNALQSAVLPQLSATEIAGTVGREEAHLAVLLPMGGAREAGRLVDAAGDNLAGESYVIRSAEAADEIWKVLTDVA